MVGGDQLVRQAGLARLGQGKPLPGHPQALWRRRLGGASLAGMLSCGEGIIAQLSAVPTTSWGLWVPWSSATKSSKAMARSG